MRTKKVTRHYCDHCSKSLSKRPSMERHEASCIQNPNRLCGLCGTQWPVDGLKKIVDNLIKEFSAKADRAEAEQWEFEDELRDGIPVGAFRNKDHGCPACVLAAIIQFGEGFPFNFDYKAEIQEWYREMNRLPYD